MILSCMSELKIVDSIYFYFISYFYLFFIYLFFVLNLGLRGSVTLYKRF